MPEPLVEDWELYDAAMKCGRARRALETALKRAAKKLIAMVKKRELCTGDHESIAKLVVYYRDSIMLPVMVKYHEYGAADTEPRYHAGQGLINALKDHFNVPRKTQMHEWGRYL